MSGARPSSPSAPLLPEMREDGRVRAEGQAEVPGVIFNENHGRFHIISGKLEELHCPFLVPPLLMLHCSTAGSDPSHSRIWFVDTDDPNLTSVLEHLADSKNNSLPQPLKWLICELPRLYNLPKHLHVEVLDQPFPRVRMGPQRSHFRRGVEGRDGRRLRRLRSL